MQHDAGVPKNIIYIPCFMFSFPLFFFEKIQIPTMEQEGKKSSSVLSF